MAIKIANNLSDDVLVFLKNSLVELRNIHISDYEKKLSELISKNSKILDKKNVILNFVIADGTTEGVFFIPYGIPFMGSPIFQDLSLVKFEDFMISKTSNNPYFFEENGEINLIFILKTRYKINSNRIFEVPINLQKSNLEENLISALLKSEIEK